MKTCSVCQKKHTRKSNTCSDKCAGIRRRQEESAASLRDETIPRQFQQMTIAEKKLEGRDGVLRILHSFVDLPSDGSRVWSEPVVYRPGDPGFEEVAAAVTPIEQIPNRMETRPKSWELC